MNAGEVVTLLNYRGITKKQETIKYLASKYDLYNEKTDENKYPGLDRVKMTRLIDAMSSDLRIAEIARQSGSTLSRVHYYINRERIDTEKVYGISLLKNKKDVERVKSFL